MSVKFRTPYQRRCICPGKCYSPEEQLYVRKEFEDGHIEFIPEGKTNVDAKIQACKDSCDIRKIVDKFLLTRDPTLLMRHQGVDGVNFQDVDLLDVMNAKNKLAQVWNGMSAEARSKFGTFDAFCANQTSEASASVSNPVSEVVENEQKQENV